MKILINRIESQKDILIYLACVFFYNLHGLDLNNNIANLYDIMKIVLFILLIVLCTMKHISIFNLPFICILVLFIWNFIMTIYMSDDYKTAIIRYLPLLSFILVIELNKFRIKHVINVMFNVIFIIVTANLYTILTMPQGYYVVNGAKYWLIGQKQEFCYVFIIGFVLAFYNIIENQKLLRSVFLIGVMSYTMIITVPMTLIICIIGVFITFSFVKINKNKIKPLYFLYINIVLFLCVIAIMILFSKMTGLQTFLKGLMYTTVTKDQTILSRTYIWKEGLDIFWGHPLTGVGIISEKLYYRISHGLISFHPHFHNIVIDQLASGGIIGFVTYFIFIWSIYYKNKILKNNIICLLYVAVFWVNIYMLVDCLYSPYIFAIFYLAYYSEYIPGRRH